jgi:hypothetical protein
MSRSPEARRLIVYEEKNKLIPVAACTCHPEWPRNGNENDDQRNKIK